MVRLFARAHAMIFGAVALVGTFRLAFGAPLLEVDDVDQPTTMRSRAECGIDDDVTTVVQGYFVADFPTDHAAQHDGKMLDPAALKIFCLKPEWGAACSKRCYAKEIPCVPLAVHPYKPTEGIGKLFSCNSLLFGYMCGYHHDNGDDCYWPVGRQGLAWCSYSGSH